MKEIDNFYDRLAEVKKTLNLNDHVSEEEVYGIQNGYSLTLLAPYTSKWDRIHELLKAQEGKFLNPKSYVTFQDKVTLKRDQATTTIIENIMKMDFVDLFFPVMRNLVKGYILKITMGGGSPSVLRKGSSLEVGVRVVLKSLKSIQESQNPKVTLYVTRDPMSGSTYLVYNPAVILRMLVEDFFQQDVRRKDAVTNFYDNIYYFMAHETMHILYGHVNGSDEYNAIFGQKLSNISMDAYINENLNSQLSMRTIDSGIDGNMYCHVYEGFFQGEYFQDINTTVPGYTKGFFFVLTEGWKAKELQNIPSDRYGSSSVMPPLMPYVKNSRIFGSYLIIDEDLDNKYHGCFSYQYSKDGSLFYNYLRAFLFERKLLNMDDEILKEIQKQVDDLKQKISDKKGQQAAQQNPQKGTPDPNAPKQPDPNGEPFKVGDIVTIKSTGELGRVMGIAPKPDGSGFDITIEKVEGEG